MFRRSALIMAIVAGLLAMPATAFAHECFVANRSAQGTQGAANGQWFVGTTDDLIVIITGDPTLVPVLSDAYREAVAAAGLPTEIAIFDHHTLGDNSGNGTAAAYAKNGKANDGKGVERFFSGGYIDQYVAILLGLLGP